MLGNRILKLRKELGLTQVELAEQAGTLQSAISMIEKGERTPTLPVLVRLADILGVSVDELLREEIPTQ